MVAVSLTGAGFLLVAANVAFIGCYNVFKAVGELGYLPAAIAMRHKRFRTPRGAVGRLTVVAVPAGACTHKRLPRPRVPIVAITVASVLLVITTGGELFRLGKVFAFGLLGS